MSLTRTSGSRAKTISRSGSGRDPRCSARTAREVPPDERAVRPLPADAARSEKRRAHRHQNPNDATRPASHGHQHFKLVHTDVLENTSGVETVRRGVLRLERPAARGRFRALRPQNRPEQDRGHTVGMNTRRVLKCSIGKRGADFASPGGMDAGDRRTCALGGRAAGKSILSSPQLAATQDCRPVHGAPEGQVNRHRGRGQSRKKAFGDVGPQGEFPARRRQARGRAGLTWSTFHALPPHHKPLWTTAFAVAGEIVTSRASTDGQSERCTDLGLAAVDFRAGLLNGSHRPCPDPPPQRHEMSHTGGPASRAGAGLYARGTGAQELPDAGVSESWFLRSTPWRGPRTVIAPSNPPARAARPSRADVRRHTSRGHRRPISWNRTF